MMTFLIILSTFLSLLLVALIVVIGILGKESEKIKSELELLKEVEDLSNKIDVNSTGFFRHYYHDTGFNIDTFLEIPIRIIRKDLTGRQILFSFDFDLFNNLNTQKKSKIIFDDDTMRYLRMRELQWHTINSPELVYCDFEGLYKHSEEELEEMNQVKIELTDFEKDDIKNFLKFSNVPEEKKNLIKKILNI